ncbi:MAG: DNA topoisomerase IV subunit A, partial [Rhodospirillales bacterium]|nr:DNA topoisomerase IV subunit A [Rhodospirillales bacterium]
KLEEMELRRERDELAAEREDLDKLVNSEARQRTRLKRDLAVLRKRYAPEQGIGARRTGLEQAGPAREIPLEAMIEREPITVIMSQRGWIRAMKGHVDLASTETLKFKEGDRLKLLLPCFTTDKLTLFATNGRTYTIRAADLPRGRGDGQPVRLLAELSNEEVVAFFVASDTAKYLVASQTGRGFVVVGKDLAAEKRTGKQVLNLKPGEEASLCIPAEGDHLAIIGDSRKLLVFPLDQVPVMSKGAGVTLQRNKDGGLLDAKVFRMEDGLTWKLGDRTRTETNLRDWLGARGQIGRLPPSGFPRNGKFGA